VSAVVCHHQGASLIRLSYLKCKSICISSNSDESKKLPDEWQATAETCRSLYIEKRSGTIQCMCWFFRYVWYLAALILVHLQKMMSVTFTNVLTNVTLTNLNVNLKQIFWKLFRKAYIKVQEIVTILMCSKLYNVQIKHPPKIKQNQVYLACLFVCICTTIRINVVAVLCPLPL
jgi:hypothetical protein